MKSWKTPGRVTATQGGQLATANTGMGFNGRDDIRCFHLCSIWHALHEEKVHWHCYAEQHNSTYAQGEAISSAVLHLSIQEKRLHRPHLGVHKAGHPSPLDVSWFFWKSGVSICCHIISDTCRYFHFPDQVEGCKRAEAHNGVSKSVSHLST